MLDSIPHDQLAYPLPLACTKIGLEDSKLFRGLLRENGIHTFVISGKQFIAAFELDRLIIKLMRQEARRKFRETEGHGTGVQFNV